MGHKLCITPTLLASLEPRAEGEYTVHDKAVSGLGVRVRSSSVKAFIASYRLPGGRKGGVRRHMIGPAEGTIAIQDARAEAKRIIAEAQLGNDPTHDLRMPRLPAKRLPHWKPRMLGMVDQSTKEPGRVPRRW